MAQCYAICGSLAMLNESNPEIDCPACRPPSFGSSSDWVDNRQANKTASCDPQCKFLQISAHALYEQRLPNRVEVPGYLP